MPAVSILISLDLLNKAAAMYFAQLPGVGSQDLINLKTNQDQV